jgi:hypothetical protein
MATIANLECGRWIGIYSGREENSFYHRSESGLLARGAKTLDLKETLPLGEAVKVS